MFSLAFFRNVLNGQRLAEVNDVFAEVAEKGGFYSEELIERVAEEGTLSKINAIPDDMKRVFVTAHDISPEWHTRMQGAFQKHCDSSISKTINLPHDADREDVREVYEMAWRLNCKGVTIYRDGCRDAQPMALKSSEKKKEEKAPAAPVVVAPRTPKDFKPRRPAATPSILSAVRIRQRTPFGHMHVTISIDPQHSRELEVFAQLGKAGDVAMSDLEAISRMVSLYLRMGGTLEQIVDQLEGIGSHMSIPTRDGRVMSLADGLAKTLQRYISARKSFGLTAILTGQVDFDNIPGLKEAGAENNANAPVAPNQNDAQMDAFKVRCPECNGVLTFSEGCVKCLSCGYSQC
jgi:ribonucleoside-diphosphate reductase alpha chain